MPRTAKYELTGEYRDIFGYEESYAYLAGDCVKHKAAVQIPLLRAGMAAYFNGLGKTLMVALNELYMKYGFYKEYLVS